MLHQLRIWIATLKSLSICIAALKHLENNSEVEGSSPTETQPSGSRTDIEVPFRSVSKYSNRQIMSNMSWPSIISTFEQLYLFIGIGWRWGHCRLNPSTSIKSLPTLKCFLANCLTPNFELSVLPECTVLTWVEPFDFQLLAVNYYHIPFFGWGTLNV